MTHRIEDILRERGLRKTQLADMLGITKQSVGAILKSPSLSSLEKIASALDVPVWQLFADPSEVCAPAAPALTCPHCGKPLRVTLEG